MEKIYIKLRSRKKLKVAKKKKHLLIQKKDLICMYFQNQSLFIFWSKTSSNTGISPLPSEYSKSQSPALEMQKLVRKFTGYSQIKLEFNNAIRKYKKTSNHLLTSMLQMARKSCYYLSDKPSLLSSGINQSNTSSPSILKQETGNKTQVMILT